MPCPSLPVSIWEDECGGSEASHVKVSAPSSGERRTSSELQMMAAVKILLQGIGEDVEREGILKTPLRVAKAFQSFFSGYELTPEGIIGGALFTEAGTDGGTGGGSGGMVVVRKIDSFALCDTCLLPFRLRCHVAYIPSGQRVVGLSKVPRVLNMLSRRLQNPYKLANELVQALYDTFEPLGVAAAVESWHMDWPGVCDKNGGPVRGCAENRLDFGWIPTTVYAASGKFENVQCSLWDEFLGILEFDGIEILRPILGTMNALPEKDKSCPFFSYSGKAECHGSVSAIALAVESFLRAVGEHADQEELQMTASRYVNWLLSATQGSKYKLLNGNVIDSDLKSSLSSYAVHCHEKGCCNPPRIDVHQTSAVGLANDHHSHSSGVACGVTNGIANGHSNGVHSGVTGGNVNGCSNGTSHGVSNGGVSAVQSIHEQSNGIISGTVNGYLNGFQRSGEDCNGIHQGLTNGTLSSYSNGIKHGVVSNGMVNGYSSGVSHIVSNATIHGIRSMGEQANGSTPLGMNPTADCEDHVDGLISLELDLPLSSLCEHHLLPFFGVVHVGYFGRGVKLERSLVLKIVQMFSRRLQVQERLTRQIAESIASLGEFQLIVVVVEANHMCIMSRGAEKIGSTTATVATIGQLASDGAMRVAFLKRMSRRGPERTSS